MWPVISFVVDAIEIPCLSRLRFTAVHSLFLDYGYLIILYNMHLTVTCYCLPGSWGTGEASPWGDMDLTVTC